MTTPGINELATDVNKPLSLSNRVLAQAEGIGLTFYTLNFARLACADVIICPEGQRVFNKCLSNLPRWACLDEKLQFGFGDRHILRNADINLYEYEHLLLSAALGEYFSDDYNAAIFSALADYFENDDRPKPQLSSFKRFVNGTNGLLAATKYPLIVDDRIRVNPYRDHDRGKPHATTTTEFIPIDRVANAIRMLGKLKAGDIKELTLVGGDIIGWFSAYVEVFLGISQSLKDSEGNILYQNNGHSNCINLTYSPPDSSQSEEVPSVIWLRKPINTTKRSDAIPPIMTGRVIGEAMFSKVFGTAFHILDQTEARAFGNALGGLARSWELWIDSEDAPPGFVSDDNRTNTASWGMGLIQTWTNWFPELRHLQGRMERALKMNRRDAGRQCQDSIERLEPFCGCYICSQTQGTDEEPTNLPKHDFCIPTMMETIIKLGLSLSRVVLVPGLFPSRAGVLAMYKAQVRRRLYLKTVDTVGWDRFEILFGNDWNSTLNRRLEAAITLFSGSRPTQDLPDNLLAISHEGMCAYVLKLQRGDHAAARSDDNMIRVLMGHINWRTKTYNRLCVGCVQPPVEISAGWESFKCEHFKERIYVK